MPGPIKRKQSIPLPASIKGLVETIFPPDDLGINPTSGVLASPLITIYKNKALREAATEAFKETGKMLGKGFEEATEQFAKQYPRVAAHIKLGTKPYETGMIHSTGKAVTKVPFHQVTERVPVEFTQLGLDRGRSIPGAAKQSIFHEGTHVAQALGNRDMEKLYGMANRAVGYSRNPFEVVARSRGKVAGKGQERATPPEITFDPKKAVYSPERGKNPAPSALIGLKAIMDEFPVMAELDAIMKRRSGAK